MEDLVLTRQFQDWAEEGKFVEFRLYYRGPLPAESGTPRPKYKHEIRRQIHVQLKELWSQHEELNRALASKPGVDDDLEEHPLKVADYFSRGKHRFLPLVRKEYGDYCSLDILFLRRDAPGNMVSSGGDLDNRIKVLLDGLRVPDVTSGMPDSPGLGEDPMFCLLQDDCLITSLSITTDRLLLPIAQDEKEHDVVLVIRVVTQTHGDRSTGTGWY